MTRSPLWCCTRIIWSSALVQASSSLSMGRARTWPTEATCHRNAFSPFSCGFVFCIIYALCSFWWALPNSRPIHCRQQNMKKIVIIDGFWWRVGSISKGGGVLIEHRDQARARKGVSINSSASTSRRRDEMDYQDHEFVILFPVLSWHLELDTLMHAWPGPINENLLFKEHGRASYIGLGVKGICDEAVKISFHLAFFVFSKPFVLSMYIGLLRHLRHLPLQLFLTFNTAHWKETVRQLKHHCDFFPGGLFQVLWSWLDPRVRKTRIRSKVCTCPKIGVSASLFALKVLIGFIWHEDEKD